MTIPRSRRGLTLADIGLSPAKAPKYKNTSASVDGLKFDSKLESARYAELRLLERSGQIRNLKVQQRFELVPAVRFKGSKRQTPAIDYVADFTYDELVQWDRHRMRYGSDEKLAEWVPVIEDCKGARTRVFLMKRHMMKALLGLDIVESKPRR